MNSSGNSGHLHCEAGGRYELSQFRANELLMMEVWIPWKDCEELVLFGGHCDLVIRLEVAEGRFVSSNAGPLRSVPICQRQVT